MSAMTLLPRKSAIIVLLLGLFCTPSSSEECYSHSAYHAGHGIRESLERQFQRRIAYEQERGTDMEKWLDTARFAFEIYFAFAHDGGVILDPKSGPNPDRDSMPADTISPKVWKAWADVLFSKYAIYDYHHPDQRMSAPDVQDDILMELLATRATLLAISGECFTRALESGFPQKPLSVERTSPPSRTSRPGNRSEYGADGRRKVDAAARDPKVLFRK